MLSQSCLLMRRVWVCACMRSTRVGVHGVRFGVLAFSLWVLLLVR